MMRIIFSIAALVAFWLEVAADWIVGARDRTEYVRAGSCRRCGNCCKCLALEMPRWIARRRRLVRVVRAWHGFALNFKFLGEEEKALIYRCGHYSEERGCAIYHRRPRLCRFFPRQKLFGYPDLHDECGYRFVKRDVLCRIEEKKKNGEQIFDEYLKKP